MSMSRLAFDQLPDAARQAVTVQVGRITSARTAGGGINSGVAAVLDTEAAGPVFVKGIPADHPQVTAQRREVAVSPFLPEACPQLRWHVEAGGWVLLGYEAVQGRQTDYTVVEDLRLVLAAMEELQSVTAPEGAGLKTAPDRWGQYADPGTAELFAGDTLLHTDWAPDNVLISDGRARVIDWAWPTRGAAWIDPFTWALRLMQAGHTVEDAVGWARRLRSWQEADPGAVQAFAVANVRTWREIAAMDGQPWKAAMEGHAVRLDAHLRAGRHR